MATLIKAIFSISQQENQQRRESLRFFYQSIRPATRWDESLLKNVGKSQCVSRNESIVANFTHFKLNVEEERYQTRMAKLLQHVRWEIYLAVFWDYPWKGSIDMAEVLRHPLTPLPLSLSHVDETMFKSPKSTLTKQLESNLHHLLQPMLQSSMHCFSCICTLTSLKLLVGLLSIFWEV